MLVASRSNRAAPITPVPVAGPPDGCGTEVEARFDQLDVRFDSLRKQVQGGNAAIVSVLNQRSRGKNTSSW